MSNLPFDNYEPLPSTAQPRRNLFKTTIALVVLVGFLSVVWMAYQDTSPSTGATPLITADAGQIKTRPAQPGGMEIPNQDKLVYNQLSGNAPKIEERLMPASEKPLAELAAMTTADGEEMDSSANVKVEKLDPLPADEAAAAAPAAPLPEAAPVKKETARTETPKQEEKANGKSTYIQLASFRSEAEAQAAWKRLQKKYAELATFNSRIVKADLKDKGTYYRLQAAMPSKDAATTQCEALKAKGQACLMVGR
ncbi:MAG: SPOR domain-containing protein [Dongiaceae bacterium]